MRLRKNTTGALRREAVVVVKNVKGHGAKMGPDQLVSGRGIKDEVFIRLSMS